MRVSPAAHVTGTRAGCADQQVPPPPSAKEEARGERPEPLAWPAEPVGGPGLGECELAGPGGAPEPNAAAWLLADLDTGEVLAARAPHARHRPASTLKVLTALLAARTLDPDTVVAGTPEDLRIDGSKVGVGPGGEYTVRQLMGGMLLNSGNDAAQALAREMGGEEAAIAAMSDLARELGALDTRPASVSGLDGPGMASSAYDLAVIFRAAMQEPLFAETTTLRQIEFPGYGDRAGFTVSNESRFLTNYRGVIGTKTGFTDAARHTFVGAAEQDGRRLVVTVMRGEQQPTPMREQAADLLDWGFDLPADTPAIGTLDAAPKPAPSVTPDASANIAAGPVDLPADIPWSAIGLTMSAVIGALLIPAAMRRRR